jgi:hypothetical protein
MQKHKLLNKIESFVKENINQSQSLVISETDDGYKVNNYRVRHKNEQWLVFDQSNTLLYALKNQRIAVLSSVMAVKKKFNNISMVNSLDHQLYGLKHDKLLFEYKIKKSSYKEIFEDRLSRTLYDLDCLYNQISELEKSVGLQ